VRAYSAAIEQSAPHKRDLTFIGVMPLSLEVLILLTTAATILCVIRRRKKVEKSWN
jgi:hypothetical protein